MTTQPNQRRAKTLILWGVAFMAFGEMLELVLDDYPGWGFMAAGAFVALVGTWQLSRRRPVNGSTDVPSPHR